MLTTPTAVVLEVIDPATVRPSPLSAAVFGFLLVATVLLLVSMVRHMRRAQSNLGSARLPASGGAGQAGSAGQAGTSGHDGQAPGEGGPR